MFLQLNFQPLKLLEIFQQYSTLLVLLAPNEAACTKTHKDYRTFVTVVYTQTNKI
jgi:hypothetical protein